MPHHATPSGPIRSEPPATATAITATPIDVSKRRLFDGVSGSTKRENCCIEVTGSWSFSA